MSPIADYNPWLPDSQQVTPGTEGGQGVIHKPGEYQNVIWQNRSRVSDGFELHLVAALEEIFASGIESLPQVVESLNSQRVFERDGTPWSEASFRHFLAVNGY